MALRQTSLPWLGQPQESAQLSRELVDRGLQSVWSNGVLMLPRGERIASGGAATVGPYGRGSAFNGTSQSIALGRDALSHGRGARIAWLRVGSASGSRTISGGGNGGTSFRLNGTGVEIINAGVQVDLPAASAVSAGEFCVLGMSAEPFNLRIYKNGLLLASRTDRGTGTAANNLDSLGQSGVGNQYFDGAIFVHASFSSRLSDEDQAALVQDPGQLFEPLSIWVPVSGGTSAPAAEFEGRSVAVAGAAGDLLTQIRLGASAASGAASSGVLSTAVRLGGTAAAAATSAGALSTGIKLAGVAPTVASAAGALSTSIRLAGSAQAQAVATGRIVSGASLGGAALGSVAATGALLTAIKLAGAASAQVMAAGALTAPAAGLSGTARALANSSASLDTAITLAGPVSTSAVAAAQLLTSIRLSAASTCEAIATGALASPGAEMRATAVANAVAAGRLATEILMAASASASAEASGRLDADGQAPVHVGQRRRVRYQLPARTVAFAASNRRVFQ